MRERYGKSEGIIRACDIHSLLWWRDICRLDIRDQTNVEVYSVKDSYRKLRIENMLENGNSWSVAWYKLVPLKVSCLVWRLFHNRLPTKDDLARRGFIGQDNTQYVGGCGAEESTSHLFFECPYFVGIWLQVVWWLEVHVVLTKDCREHLDQFEALINNSKSAHIKSRAVWFACIWIIWKERNNIFKNVTFIVDQMFNYAQRQSWKWLSIKHKFLN